PFDYIIIGLDSEPVSLRVMLSPRTISQGTPASVVSRQDLQRKDPMSSATTRFGDSSADPEAVTSGQQIGDPELPSPTKQERQSKEGPRVFEHVKKQWAETRCNTPIRSSRIEQWSHWPSDHPNANEKVAELWQYNARERLCDNLME